MKNNNYDLLAVNFINAVNKYDGKIILLSSYKNVDNISEYYEKLLNVATFKGDKFLYVDMLKPSEVKGLYDYIHGDFAEVEDLIDKSSAVHTLPCGSNAIGLCEVSRLIADKVLDKLAESYDKVFVSIPAVPNSAIMHSFSYENVGVVLTVNKENTRLSALKTLIEKINASSMQVLGLFIAEKDGFFTKLMKRK